MNVNILGTSWGSVNESDLLTEYISTNFRSFIWCKPTYGAINRYGTKF